MYKDNKEHLIKLILWDLYFDGNNADDNHYPIFNPLARKIHRMINWQSSILLNKIEALKKANAIKFDDIYNNDPANALNSLAEHVIRCLYDKIFNRILSFN